MYSAYSQARGQVFAAVCVGFRDSIFITFLGEGTSIYAVSYTHLTLPTRMVV